MLQTKTWNVNPSKPTKFKSEPCKTSHFVSGSRKGKTFDCEKGFCFPSHWHLVKLFLEVFLKTRTVFVRISSEHCVPHDFLYLLGTCCAEVFIWKWQCNGFNGMENISFFPHVYVLSLGYAEIKYFFKLIFQRNRQKSPFWLQNNITSTSPLGLHKKFSSHFRFRIRCLTKQLPSICFAYNEGFYVFSSSFSVIYLVLMIQKLLHLLKD